jgi:glutamate--cysteine ligase
MNKINHSPLKKLLAQKIKIHSQKISEWIHAHAAKAPLPIYSSVDLRDSDYKIVPVDSNLYPAGFNNICPEDRRTAPPLLRDKILKEAGTQVKKILILPENNTHNTYYLENLYYLQQLLIDGGFDVQIGWYLPEQIFQKTFSSSFELTTASQKQLTVYPIKINQNRLTIDLTDQSTFDPDFILVNNDFSSGYPIALEQVQQPIMPSFKLGWHTRKKSTHFEHYNRLAKEFSELIQIDPWLIQIDSVSVDDVNFNEEQGIDRVAKAVEGVLQRTQQAYLQHQITHEPFAFVKNNSGTYGMGIMVVHSSEELLHLNRRAKNKMSVGKNHQQIQSVVIQEGIPTATLVDRLAAEPVIYLAGRNSFTSIVVQKIK